LAGNYTDKLMADSGKWESSQVPAAAEKLKAGVVTPVSINEDGNGSFQYILNTYPPLSPKQFDEARGEVINELQVELEEKWLASLRKKYPVKVNPQVLADVKKELVSRKP
jgi:peptidyl-prolyl cis-trans isomerase SurA